MYVIVHRFVNVHSKGFFGVSNILQLNKYETAPKIYSMKPKLDIGLFVDLAEFPCFYQFLHEVAHKIVQQIKTKQFYEQLHARTGKNREIQLNQHS